MHGVGQLQQSSMALYSCILNPLIKEIEVGDFPNLKDFWVWIKEDFLKSDKGELYLKGHGKIRKSILQFLSSSSLFVRPEELIYYNRLEIAEIQKSIDLELTSLHLAVIVDSIDWCEIAIHDHRIDCLCKQGKTPIDYALEKGDETILYHLLVTQLEFSSHQKNGLLLTHVAEKGFLDSVNYLLRMGYHENLNMAIKHAIQNNHYKVVKCILQFIFEVEFSNVSDFPPIFFAIAKGREDIVCFLLESGVDVNQQFKDLTPLIFAVFKKKLSIIDLLIKNGAQLDPLAGGSFPLLFYSMEGRGVAVMRHLLTTYNMDPNVKSKDNLTPLHEAARRGYLANVKLLIENGADVNAIDKNGYPPLFYAIKHKQEEVVCCLLDLKEIKVDYRFENLNTFFHHAATNLSYICVSKMFDLIPFLNQKNEFEETPLFFAFEARNFDALKWMLTQGADPTIMSKRQGSLVHAAAKLGNSDVLGFILSYCTEVDLLDFEGRTPLFYAIQMNNQECIDLLMKNKAVPFLADQGKATVYESMIIHGLSELFETCYCPELNALQIGNVDQNSFLHLAVIMQNDRLVKFLCDQGFDPNCRNAQWVTPLMLVLCENNQTILDCLLLHGADPALRDCFGYSSLHYAVNNHQDLDVIKKLCYSENSNHFFYSEQPFTALDLAVKENLLNTVEYLLQLQFDPNQFNSMGTSPILLSIENPQILKLIIDYKGNVQFQDKQGYSIIDYALFGGSLDCVKILVEAGTEFDKKILISNALSIRRYKIVHYLLGVYFNKPFLKLNDVHPLITAAKEKRGLFLDLLLIFDVNPNVTDISGKTALHYAAKNGDLHCCCRLLCKDANPNQQDENGWTPLHYAIYYKHNHVVSQLMEIKVKINSIDINGNTLLHLAAEAGSFDIFKKLLDRKISLDYKNRSGLSAFHLLAKRGHTDLMIYVLTAFPNQINHLTAEKKTVLSLAFENNHFKLAEKLISYFSKVSPEEHIHLFLTALKSKESALIDLFISEQIPLPIFKQDEEFLVLFTAAVGGNLYWIQKRLMPNLINHSNNRGYTLLHAAARFGQLEIVDYLISQGADINQKNHDGYTSVLLSAMYGHSETVEKLIEAGCDIEVVTNKRWNLFFCAIIGGLEDLVIQILNKDQTIVHYKSTKSETALHLAVYNSRVEIARLLLENGIDYYCLDENGLGPLHIAGAKSNLEMIHLLEQYQIDFNQVDQMGRTVLHHAVIGRNKKVIKYLVEMHPELLIREDQNGNLPIHYAIKMGEEKITSGLYSLHMDAWMLNRDGDHPIHMAIRLGHCKIIGRFLRLGIDVNIQNRSGETPLHVAIKEGQLQVFYMLLSFSPNLEVKNNSNQTPLHYASIFNQPEIVMHLIEQGASPYALDDKKITPFYYSLKNGFEKVNYQFLMSFPLENLKDANGNTPLILATQNKAKNLVEFLLKIKADPNQLNLTNTGPLHVAANLDQTEVIKMLIESNANLNQRDIYGAKPIHYSAKSISGEAFRTIVALSPCSINSVDYKGGTPLSYALFAKSIPVIEQLGALGPTYALYRNGFAPLYSLWIWIDEYYKNKSIEQFPNEYLIAKEIRARQNLWYYVLPNIIQGTLKKKDGTLLQVYQYYYCHVGIMLREVIRSLYSFACHFPKHLDQKLASDIISDFNNRMSRSDTLRQGLPLFVLSGFQKHLVTILIWENWFCICNRGLGALKNVEAYKINKEEWTESSVWKLEELKKLSKNEFQDYIDNELLQKYDFKTDIQTNRLEKIFENIPSQLEGSCSYTSTEMAMGAFFAVKTFLSETEDNLDKNKIRAIKTAYNDWVTFMQVQGLKESVETALNSQFLPDSYLIEESFMLLNGKEMDCTNREILHQAEMVWKELSNLSPCPIRQNEWVWKGRQASRNKTVDVEAVRRRMKELNNLAPTGIRFVEEHITNKLEKGFCTAQAIDFLDQYFNKRGALHHEASVQQIRQIVMSLKDNFQRANKIRRNLQGAFDTIEVNRELNLDYSLLKVQALLNSCGFVVRNSSIAFHIGQNPIEFLQVILNNCPVGAYFIRVIIPEDNHKLEECGHSMIYLKEKEIGFLYDPSFGLRDLYCKDHVLEIYNYLRFIYGFYDVYEARFYYIQQTIS